MADVGWYEVAEGMVALAGLIGLYVGLTNGDSLTIVLAAAAIVFSLGTMKYRRKAERLEAEQAAVE